MTRHLATLSCRLDQEILTQSSFALGGLFCSACFIIAWTGTSLKRGHNDARPHLSVLYDGDTPTHAEGTRHGINRTPDMHWQQNVEHSLTRTHRASEGLPRTRLCCRWPPIVLHAFTMATPKSRFRTPATRAGIVELYRDTLKSVWTSVDVTFHPWYSPDHAVLHCKAMPDVMPPGFSRVGPDRFQFSFTYGGTRLRPVAYRVPFLTTPGFSDSDMTVSHLCHHNWCMNWEHHVLEPLAVNKARNGCPGGPHCHHTVRCLRPGEHFDA